MISNEVLDMIQELCIKIFSKARLIAIGGLNIFRNGEGRRVGRCFLQFSSKTKYYTLKKICCNSSVSFLEFVQEKKYKNKCLVKFSVL